MDAERDVYEELLTQAEIQGNVNKVNCKFLAHFLVCIFVIFTSTSSILKTRLCSVSVSNSLTSVEQALFSGDEDRLYQALSSSALGLQSLKSKNKGWYLKQLMADREVKEQVMEEKWSSSGYLLVC